ncbi:MAG: hypothetical protein R6X29_03995 [Acidimicrobiia bacterium]
MLDDVVAAVAETHRGRRWVVAYDAAAGSRTLVEALEEWGAAGVMVVAATEGVGRLPEVPVHYTRTSGDTVMTGLRAFERSLVNPDDALLDALERFDPRGEAGVIAVPFSTFEHLAARPVHGQRRPEWLALEDKTTVDGIWDAAGVGRAPSTVVSVADAPAAAERLAGPGGTMWAADNTEGWHGGGEYARWVPDPSGFEAAVEWFAGRARTVRVMPFLDGLPCSIHGFVGSTKIGVFRPVEMLILRRTDRPGLVYAGFSTYWDPPADIRQSMREAARRVAVLLRDRVGYRGGFSVDGVLVAEGFRPTELNPRTSAGLGMQAFAAEVPIGSITRCLIAGEVEVDGAELEAAIVPGADARRLGGMGLLAPDHREGAEVRVRFDADRAVVAGAGEEADGPLAIGPAVSGSYVRLELDPGRIQPGPSLAPVTAKAANLAIHLWSLSLPRVEAAPDPFAR